MEFVLTLVIGVPLNWAALMLVIPLAARIAGFSFPGIKEAALKLAVVVLVTNVIALTLAPAIGIGASVINLVIFWTAMVKWFDVDLMGAVVIVVLSYLVNIAMGIVMVGLFGLVA